MVKKWQIRVNTESASFLGFSRNELVYGQNKSDKFIKIAEGCWERERKESINRLNREKNCLFWQEIATKVASKYIYFTLFNCIASESVFLVKSKNVCKREREKRWGW